MSGININIANKISLAEAARLSGYHQDYLGQLCRGGKLRGFKYGRNWFTTQEALDEFKASLLTAFESPSARSNASIENDMLNEVVTYDVTYVPAELSSVVTHIKPEITQTVLVSQVEGLPIKIQTAPVMPRGANAVQNLLTNMRIQNLQGSVAEIQNVLEDVVGELAKHKAVLEKKPWLHEGQGKPHFAGSFDFTAQPVQTFDGQSQKISVPSGSTSARWVVAMACMVSVFSVSYSGYSLFAYSAKLKANLPSQPAGAVAEVAGAVDETGSSNLDLSNQLPHVQQRIDQLQIDKQHSQNLKASETILGPAIGEVLQ